METKTGSLAYTVLDVFTETMYTGNQLAVIQIKEDLTRRQYEDIAREFGYSESSFVFYSPEDKALRIRSFTSAGFEIHGAGHNLLGVVCNSLLKGEPVFRDQAGAPYVIMKDDPVYLEIDRSSSIPVVGMKQRPASVGKKVPKEKLASGLSLMPSGFSDELEPTVVSTEVAHLMVPLKDIDTLDKAHSNKTVLTRLSEEYGFEGVYCFSLTKNNESFIAEARFFNPLIGIDEDPATGSAAGPLAGFLHKSGYIKLNTLYQLLQGKIMNRPSVIHFKVTDSGIWVSGSSVITMEGNIVL